MEKELLQTLDAAGIRFVRILWCDNANIIRGKAVHRGAIAEYIKAQLTDKTQESLPLNCS
jgi:glutamine synthetase